MAFFLSCFLLLLTPLSGIFVAQSLMLYVVGLRVFVALHEQKHMSIASANTVAFISYLGLTAAFAEAFYWMIERPSMVFAAFMFEWSRS